MSTGTSTTTYTVTDIKHVFDRFAADFWMICQSTKLKNKADANQTIADVRSFAENKYIESVHVILKDSTGKQLKAAVYRVSEDAGGWRNELPGGSMWPQTPSGSLEIVIEHSPLWSQLSQDRKNNFLQSLEGNWGPSEEDITYPTLTASSAQTYQSGTFGLKRTNFN